MEGKTKFSKYVGAWFVIGFLLMIGLAISTPTSADDEELPNGQPFQLLQQQIDNLYDLIANIGTGQTPISEEDLIGTWQIYNAATDETGEVTFNGDGTYTINSGQYDAGGSWWPVNPNPVSSGTYEIIEGKFIGFNYDGADIGLPFNRIAMVVSVSQNKIVHFLLGHTHSVEILTK